MSHDDILRHSRQLKRRRERRKWLWFLAWSLAFFLVIVVLLNTGRFSIDRIQIEGAKTVNPDVVANVINQTLAGRYGGLIPRRIVWFYPRRDLEAALAGQFPRLATTSFEINDKTVLRVKVTERREAVRWCRSDNNLVCYFADDQGFIFSPAPVFSPHVFITISSPLPAEPINTAPLSADDFHRLLNFREELLQNFATSTLIDLVVYQIQQEAPGEFSLLAENSRQIGDQFKILINLEENLATAVANAKAALLSPTLLATSGKQTALIEYLDLRFPPKVFYKFRPGI